MLQLFVRLTPSDAHLGMDSVKQRRVHPAGSLVHSNHTGIRLQGTLMSRDGTKGPGRFTRGHRRHDEMEEGG